MRKDYDKYFRDNLGDDIIMAIFYRYKRDKKFLKYDNLFSCCVYFLENLDMIKHETLNMNRNERMVYYLRFASRYFQKFHHCNYDEEKTISLDRKKYANSERTIGDCLPDSDNIENHLKLLDLKKIILKVINTHFVNHKNAIIDYLTTRDRYAVQKKYHILFCDVYCNFKKELAKELVASGYFEKFNYDEFTQAFKAEHFANKFLKLGFGTAKHKLLIYQLLSQNDYASNVCNILNIDLKTYSNKLNNSSYKFWLWEINKIRSALFPIYSLEQLCSIGGVIC